MGRGHPGPPRADRDARDSGQYGFALRYFADELNTEFGAYTMNYHSRLPIFSGQGASASTMAAINDLATRLAAINPALAAQAAAAAPPATPATSSSTRKISACSA
ncbi:DUF1302 family protein [Pseudomonas aeruginosa]|nr:DUF1302 family protein [Pseudomonas aeruginosa]